MTTPERPALQRPIPNQLVVRVTWADLWFAKQFQPTECPLALALRRETGVRHWIVATGRAISLFKADEVRFRFTSTFPRRFDRVGLLAFFSPRTVRLERLS